MEIPQINIKDYLYDLPDSKIPDVPAQERDLSKLLVYKNGQIQKRIFNNLPDELPSNALLVFNNSKVFPARLIFEKTTGARIEIFCLRPLSQTKQMNGWWFMTWECMVGNLKRWKNDEILYLTSAGLILKTSLHKSQPDGCVVRFSWQGTENIYEILEMMAELPLPPYMNRKATGYDKERYQTVYAQPMGSVAAPTAGLHFTPKVLAELQLKGIETTKLTLHVGAGTFKPVKSDTAADHIMHEEQFTIDKKLIIAILQDKHIIPVGTTSLRVLESIYWLGLKLLADPGYAEFKIGQWDGFTPDNKVSKEEALNALLTYFNHSETSELHGSTKIFIIPGYTFRICKGVITNFHQPGSTLILLVAALLGNNWRKVYDYALLNDFRFLSYGDSSLLFP